jgi:hypothetical protein
VFTVKKILLEDGSEIEQVDCYDTSTDQFVHISGSKGHEIENQLLDEFHNGMITSGQSTLMQEGAYFDDEEGSLILPNLENVQYGEDPETRRKLAVTTGTKEILAVRVIALDASTTSSESEISGTSGDAVNLKSQYEARSYNKLQINPANTNAVSNGVTTVNISNNVSGTSDSTIRTAVVNAATASLGNLSSQFDHLMLCLPPGTSGGWIAYAYVNSWLSVYNNQWCNYVSGQMHGKYNVIFQIRTLPFLS